MHASPTSRTDTTKLISSAQSVLECVNGAGKNIPLRLFGSAAIAMRCPNSLYLWQAVDRKAVRDIDFVTMPQYRERIKAALTTCGYTEVEGSMATNAQYRRLYFHKADTNFLIELHSAPLMFHHRIPLNGELLRDSETLTLADLALTKLQWGDLCKNMIESNLPSLINRRDALLQSKSSSHAAELLELESQIDLLNENTAQLLDCCVLFAEHPLATNGGQPGISTNRILSLCKHDWGLWTTLRRNLKALESFTSKMFSSSDHARDRILERVRQLRILLKNISETSFKWQVDSAVRKIVCERCVPIGNPVEEPRRDVWRRES